MFHRSSPGADRDWGETPGELLGEKSGPDRKLLVRPRSSGADDGIRTRDPHLGKVVLYQLSHVRVARKFIRRLRPGQAPLEPNPPFPRDVSVRSTTSMGWKAAKGTTRSWAMRSPRLIS